ncbi:MAG: hypothetical protein LAQ30_19480 [Acidobacteriia bacterium]|nr:hypothetical protein [Terriglobia bacterium]
MERLGYVDRNPVRAGMVGRAAEYRWSSAAAHLSGEDPTGVLDTARWRREAGGVDWDVRLRPEDAEAEVALRRCTYAGRPFGEEAFVKEMSVRFGRYWARGRPKKQTAGVGPTAPSAQLAFFAD